MKRQLIAMRTLVQQLLCCQIPLRYLRTVYFPHPVGIVIGSEARIGRNVTIYQNVTIGRQRNATAKSDDYPVLEDNVVVYAGAVIVGRTTIGAGSVVGANAVISKDVPPGSLAYGYNQVKPRKS